MIEFLRKGRKKDIVVGCQCKQELPSLQIFDFIIITRKMNRLSELKRNAPQVTDDYIESGRMSCQLFSFGDFLLNILPFL